ncbi:tumor protein D52-like isoform X20 [Scylla paramamosain]|uniref:tumor protein D52-like isoform X20 n=1 Tax=Scylla paramamosain TaxID=85552 RepID=UPI003082A537
MMVANSLRKSSSLLGSLASLTSVGSAGTAEEVTYDAVTPDSGVHENFNALSPDEQEKLREEWKAELAKTEEEIQTLRQVLGAKVKTAQDLKRRLGITVWREFTEDLNNSMKTVRESQPSQYVQNLPVYQKTAGAMSAVGEKTSSLFGGIGAKFGQLKETPTFKSFEERVGGVYSAARTRMGGSGSNSTQDFEEALKEAEGEKAALEAANGGTLQTSTTPGTDVTQPAAS